MFQIIKASPYALEDTNQVCSAVFMIKPTDFKFNEQAAQDNEFMELSPMSKKYVTQRALKAFEKCVQNLREEGVVVLVLDKANFPALLDIDLPDAVFPDHFTTWANGDITIYKMKHENRNQEKVLIPYILNLLIDAGYKVGNVHYLEKEEVDLGPLEAKGSLILDRKNKRVYASLSQRTCEESVRKWAKDYGFEPIIFKSLSQNGKEVYHTDVILSIGDKFVVVCDESIEQQYRAEVLSKLSEDREIVRITMDQAFKHFACNCAEIRAESSSDKHHVFIMSDNAITSLSEEQKYQISKYATIVRFPNEIIEKVGGGSARCMIAELFNPYLGPMKHAQSPQKS